MSVLNPEVYVYFDNTNTPDADVFTLDDPTKGVLDGVTYTLAGEVAFDLSQWVRAVSFGRGRDRQLDQFNTGTCSIDLIDMRSQFLPDELLDIDLVDDADVALTDDDGSQLTTIERPWDSAQVVPGKRVDVYSPGGREILFTGFVTAWEHRYSPDGMVLAGIAASDHLYRLASAEFEAWTPSVETSGARISAALARPELEYPAVPLNISTGGRSMQAQPVAVETRLLSYLRLVSKSDDNNPLYVDRTGTLNYVTTWPPVGSATTLSDQAGGGIPYSEIEVSHNSDLLYTRVAVTRQGGTRQLVSDAAAITKYGVSQLTLTGLLLTTDAEALAVANSLLARYKSPAARVSAVTFKMEAQTPADQLTISTLDVGSLVDVAWQPSGTTAPETTSHVVEGVSHSSTVTDVWMVRLELGEA